MSTTGHIGDYRVLDILGRGGMGVVYHAAHAETGAEAAVKTVAIATATTLESIRREIQTLRELRHPGVVTILGHGVTSGVPWYAMELLRGRTLRDDLRAWFPDASLHDVTTRDLQRPGRDHDVAAPSPTPPAPPYSLTHVATLFRNLCAPLAYVHGQGVIHRDLSPANVFLVGATAPVLFDFGLAAQVRKDSARDVLDVGGLTRGTVHYMAPEQARGEIVDARADIYALGCLLYEALTGQPPFLGDSALSVLMRHIEELPPPPSALVPTLPHGFNALVMHMLAKRPRDRIGYAEDVAARLERLGAPAAPPSVHGPAPRAYTYRPELAGRSEVLDELELLLRRLAGGGGGGAVCLLGESGVGKTRLAGELARRAGEHELRVLTGECEPLGLGAADELHGAPLHPLRPLLRAVADRCRDGGHAETQRILGAAGGVLAAYEPALAGLAPALEDRLEPTAARFRVLGVLRDVLREFTRGAPLLLVLDDLQWADELTLALLASLGGPLDGLIVVLTARIEEMTPALDGVVAALGARRLDVPRLDRAAVRAIVHDMLALDDDAPALAERIAIGAEGNPLFAAEYVRAAVDEGVLCRDLDGRWRLTARDDDSSDRLPTPGSVTSLVRRRLRTLSPAARLLALTAAVLGRSCDAEVLAATAELPADVARHAVAELLQRQVLHEAGGLLRFAHDKLREQAYADQPDADRRQRHLRAATVLDARYRDDADLALHYAALARHWEQGGQLPAACDYLERAAEHALANAAFGEARRLLVHLLELAPTAAPLRRARWSRWLGEASFALGDLAACATHTGAALTLLGQPLPASRLGWSSSVAGGLLRQLVSRAIRRADADPRLVDAALAAARMTSCYFFNDDALGLLGAALAAINLAERAGAGVPIAESYAQLGYVAGIARLGGVATRYFAKARAIADATHDPIGLGRALFAEAAYDIGAGRWAEARRAANRGLALAESLRNPQEQEVAHTILGHCDFATGDYPASLLAAGRLHASAHGRANRQHEAWGVYTQARAHLYQGRLDDAIADFDRAMGLLEGVSDQASHILCGGMLASALARAGRRERARALADATTATIGDRTPAVFTITEGFVGVADAYLELWRQGDAAVAAPARIALANLARLAKILPIAAPAAAILDGVWQLRAGAPGRATRPLRRGLELAEQRAMPYEQALAHAGLAAVAGADAAAHAGRARALFTQLGCAWHLATLAPPEPPG